MKSQPRFFMTGFRCLRLCASILPLVANITLFAQWDPLKDIQDRAEELRDTVNSAAETLGQVNQAITETLANGNKRITEELANGNKRVTEELANGNKMITETLANGNRRFIEELANGNKLVTETLANGNKIMAEFLANGNSIVTEVASNGSGWGTATLSDGTTFAMRLLPNGNQVLFPGGAFQSGLVLFSDANKEAQTATYKAFEDSLKGIQGALTEVFSLAETFSRFTDREIQNGGAVINRADQRIREGKPLDAVWGLSVEPFQGTSKNAGKATQENNTLNMAGAILASAYGGPAGAAAYASWSTYELTGDAELALKQGLISGLGSATSAQIAQMPAITKGDIALKVTLHGTKRALEVAARGGSHDDVKKALLQQMFESTATALGSSAQSGQDQVTSAVLEKAAKAGAVAVMNSEDENAVRKAIMKEIAQSLADQACTNLNEEAREKLHTINRAIFASSLNALAVSASGGSAEEVRQRLLSDAGRIIIDGIEISTQATSRKDALVDYARLNVIDPLGKRFAELSPSERSAMNEAFDIMAQQWRQSLLSGQSTNAAKPVHLPRTTDEHPEILLSGEWSLFYERRGTPRHAAVFPGLILSYYQSESGLMNPFSRASGNTATLKREAIRQVTGSELEILPISGISTETVETFSRGLHDCSSKTDIVNCLPELKNMLPVVHTGGLTVPDIRDIFSWK